MHPTVACCVSCGDRRLPLLIMDLIRSLELSFENHEVDMQTIPGGGATNEWRHRQDIWDYHRLHKFRLLILVAHHDCGKIQEEEVRLQNMKANADWARQALGVEVRCFIADPYEKIWEEIKI